MRFPNPFRVKPPTAPPAFAANKVLPEHRASYDNSCPISIGLSLLRFPSRLIFQWIAPFLDVGFTRPLEKEGESCLIPSTVCMNHLPEKDLWTLPDNMLTASVSYEVENNFYSRCEPEKRPPFIQERLESASRSPSHTLIQKEKDIDSEKAAPRPDTKKSPKYDSSLFITLYKTFTTRIWFAGFLKLFSGALLRFSHPADLISVSRHAQDDHTFGYEGVLGVARRILCLLPPQQCGKGC